MNADEQLYHVGWPADVNTVVTRAARGLPVYLPTDPKPIDQAPYLRFAAKRGPNTA